METLQSLKGAPWYSAEGVRDLSGAFYALPCGSEGERHQPCCCYAAEFSRNSVRLVKRCSKPDGKEFQKVSPDVLIASIIMANMPLANTATLSASR